MFTATEREPYQAWLGRRLHDITTISGGVVGGVGVQFVECPRLLHAHLDQLARGVAHRGLLALIGGEQLVDEHDGRRQLAVRFRPQREQFFRQLLHAESAWRCARARSRCCFAMRALTADTGIPAALATVAAKLASSSGSSSLIASIAIASSTTPAGVASASGVPRSARRWPIERHAEGGTGHRHGRTLWMTSAPSGARITLALQRP